MDDKIKDFLNSDFLENYLLGNTSDQETLQVERYLALYPDIKKTSK